MNYYQLFYWLTVADGVKHFFDAASDILTFFTVPIFIAWIIASNMRSAEVAKYGDDDKDAKGMYVWVKTFRRLFAFFFIGCIITWMGFVFTPNKRDSLVIIAGGAVGNFITRDSSARQLPSEVINLLRVKIREEVNTSTKVVEKVKLEDLTKEELINLVKEKEEKHGE